MRKVIVGLFAAGALVWAPSARAQSDQSPEQMRSASGLRFQEASGEEREYGSPAPVSAGRAVLQNGGLAASRPHRTGAAADVASPEIREEKASAVPRVALFSTVGALAGLGLATVLGVIPSAGIGAAVGLAMIGAAAVAGAYYGYKTISE
ncbi:MAG: hypothetical protein HY403_07020 [Elusimicrobia bacterium]|nr:hypothetical protein [Elusimicrobiota bacterium]